ncbi:MAG: hypothetical protein VYB54_04770 [Pseudomonadota bacterium]|nr:hypothetical protein [Pseudomonadota bacterium]
MADRIDYSTQHGASILALRIRDYWTARGLDVRVGITPTAKSSNGERNERHFFGPVDNLRIRKGNGGWYMEAV